LGVCSTFWSIGLISQFLDHSQTVGLVDRVISSSQGLYLNTGQHKHRKTHTHIKHLCPEWDWNPRSRPPSERRQYIALDRSATVTGTTEYRSLKFYVVEKLKKNMEIILVYLLFCHDTRYV
jgi:hypothetical protein